MAGHAASLTRLDDGITAIDTEYVRPLQDASHLVVENGRAAFVDTGTNYSVPLLLDALRQCDIDVADVDFVFLTHIHLDHAGGAGLLMQSLPNARCVVHPRGAPHLVDPARLIAGTEAVYGIEATRAMYGTLQPLEEARVEVAGDGATYSLAGREFHALHTEGHARHHYVLHDPTSRGVFTGDNFGVSYRELDTAAGEMVFPTTTPAAFDPVEAHRSVDRIIACDPQFAFLTHYSRVGNLQRLAADMHAGIDAYVEIARANQGEADRVAAIGKALLERETSRAREHGVTSEDEALRAILEPDARLNAQGLEAWLQRQER